MKKNLLNKLGAVFAVAVIVAAPFAIQATGASAHDDAPTTLGGLMQKYGGTLSKPELYRVRWNMGRSKYNAEVFVASGPERGWKHLDFYPTEAEAANAIDHYLQGGVVVTPTVSPTTVPPTTVPPTTVPGVSGAFFNVPNPATGKVSIEFRVTGASPARVDFLLTGSGVSITHTEAVAPFEFIGSVSEGFGWDTSQVANGMYNLRADAKDAMGMVLASGDVMVMVSNGGAQPTTVPTAVPTVGPQPTPGNFSPNASAPYCTEHDANQWHGLWNSDLGCWYDHDHGDDPHAVDDVFGTQLWSLIGTGGEFGFPWQTYMVMPNNHIMRENDIYPYGKHQGYKWFVRKNVPCVSRFGVNCFTDMRVLVHFVGSEIDDNVQYHTALIEARACAKGGSPCGTILTGGWQDYGTIKLDGQNLGTTNCDQNNKLLYNNTGNRSFATWYPCGGLYINAAVETADHWDYFTAGALPRNGLSLCTGQSSADNYDIAQNAAAYANTCGNDNSKRQLHGLFMNVDDDFDGTNDGRINYSGWTDRYGADAPNCTAPAQDCIPFIAKGLPVVSGQFQYRDDDMTFFNIPLRDVAHPFNKNAVVGAHIEYDPLPSALKIKYPN